LAKLFERLLNTVPRWVEERYPEPVALLLKANDDSAAFWGFFWACIEDAEVVAAWKRANEKSVFDPFETERRADVTYLDKSRAIVNALRETAQFIDRHPLRAGFSLGDALLQVKAKSGRMPLIASTVRKEGVDVFKAGPGSAPDVLARLLEAYAEALDERPFAKAGAMQHRRQLGCMLYPEPVDQKSGRPDVLATSLLFSLVLRARAFTSEPRLRVSAGTPMPTAGQPMWNVAAAFVNAVFDLSVTKHDVQKRLSMILRRNPGLMWAPFAPPPPSFVDVPPFHTWRE
jgi:hypothetical protein